MATIISQMVDVATATTQGTSKENTPTYLTNIYNKMRESLNSMKDFSNGTAKAKRLEYFLNLIKQAQKSYKINGADNFIEELVIDETEKALLRELYAVQPALFSRGGMYSLGSGKSSRGQKLEDDLSRWISGAYATEGKKTYTYAMDLFKSGKIGIGKEHVTSQGYLDDLADDAAKKIQGKLYRQAKDAMDVAAGKAEKIREEYANSILYIPTIQGKIDVTGLHAELKFSGVLTLQQEMLQLLNEANFTAKNYASAYDLHLGRTNPYYVFSMVSSGSGENVAGRWVRMLMCFNRHGDIHSEAPRIFYRIRAIYELTGYGQVYKNSELSYLNNSGANYLVFNPIGSDIVHVTYTGDIINSLISSIDKLSNVTPEDALFAEIVLPQSYYG